MILPWSILDCIIQKPPISVNAIAGVDGVTDTRADQVFSLTTHRRAAPSTGLHGLLAAGGVPPMQHGRQRSGPFFCLSQNCPNLTSDVSESQPAHFGPLLLLRVNYVVGSLVHPRYFTSATMKIASVFP